MTRPRVLIEDWLPIAEIGVEARRENSTGQHPPPNRLHVWWARRPLIASRAAVLASVLPSWDEGWPDELLEHFPIEKDYHEWFVHLLGIRGDPVAARERIRWANKRGIRLDKAYEGPRAFTIGPDAGQVAVLRQLLAETWGLESPVVLDPMAGGGSIPFESLRFGFHTLANELNPVASFVLQGTLALPARLGPEFADEVARWGRIWAQRIEQRLDRFFPRQAGESIHAYIFARTVACPETGNPVPLAPNWWLRRGNSPVAVRLLADPDDEQCRFELVRGRAIDFDPGIGTVNRGEGRSPWTGATIPSRYIKAEAQAGRMGAQMYAVAIKTGQGSDFRLPTSTDLAGVAAAEEELSHVVDRWRDTDIIPAEHYPEIASDMRPHHYGMSDWSKFFSPRQLLVLGTAVEELRRLGSELIEHAQTEIANAIVTYLALALDKAADYNSWMARWDPSRGIRDTFDRHDFSFKWSPSEWDGAHNLLDWAVAQVVDSYRGIAELVEPSRHTLFSSLPEAAAGLVKAQQGDASDLPYETGSVHAVVVDPPYYDNVQYAELSDFFYVWEKRTVGRIYPELFSSELIDKAQEAVANPARFEALDKKRAKDLAKADYERKMTRVFAEARRVLRDEGVLTVMFTHKTVEAWDSLGRSLIEAGFEIESSWPVRTESEFSLHQAKKAAAASTILLTCRKRAERNEATWWDDVESEVRTTAREKASEFVKSGIKGVDVYIATFGPALSVISRQWPVFTSAVDPETAEPVPLRPEEALDSARKEVAGLRRQGLLLGRDVEFDPVTDWYLLAWDAFGAVEFPYDEARKLALAIDLDLESELVRTRVVTKKGSTVVIQEPRQRRRPGLADTEGTSFTRLIDAAHALMVAQQEDGVRGAEAFLKRTRLGSDARFQALLQALINAIPRTKEKGRFLRPEAAALDQVVVSGLLPDLQIPPDPEVAVEPTQGAFPFADGEEGFSNEEDDGEGGED